MNPQTIERPARGKRHTSWLTAALLLALSLAPESMRAQVVAITGGKVYPVSGPPIENGTVLIRDGRITAVGRDLAIPAGARRIDATGTWVTPGLVNAATQLALGDVSFGAEPRDAAARGKDAIAAGFTVIDGLNPASVLIPPAREDGVTTVGLIPTGSLVAGQAAAIDLVDGPAAQMILRAPFAMVAELGDVRRAGVTARGELLGKLRELLDDVRTYARRRADFDRNQTRAFAASRRDLEAMVPVLEGRLPLLIEANRASDIDAALTLAKDYKLRLMIGGGEEAWLVAERLAAAKVPVLAGALNNIPRSFSTLGARQDNLALLKQAGVAIAIIGNAGGGGDEEAFNVRNVRIEAGNAVAYGLAWGDALRAITLAPAELLGVAGSVGSLQAGREANVVVWNGDPLEIATRAEHVLVRGREYEEPSRQDLLTRRYMTLPPKY
ncbi:MAG: amidohydrolase family protein [Gemmatimonadaceae bacterium]